MRLTILLVLCLTLVAAHAAVTKKPTGGAAPVANRATSRAPAPKSAYTYLRKIRGPKSCASGTCPFWERHGRSFAALRCYAQEYKDCTCLHRMCFSSCMFSQAVCNQEMVSCLQQICRRCMPVASQAICSVYDSTAQRVAESLSVFSCYACCPIRNIVNPLTNNSAANGVNSPAAPGTLDGNRPLNAGSNSNMGNNVAGAANSNGSPRPTNGNANVNSGNNSPNVNSGNNIVTNNNNNSPNRNQQQAVKQRVVATKSTTRRVRVTKSRIVKAASTVRANVVKNGARAPVTAQKKPQVNNGVKN